MAPCLLTVGNREGDGSLLRALGWDTLLPLPSFSPECKFPTDGWKRVVFGAPVSYVDIGHEKGNIFSKEVSNLSVPTGLSLITINWSQVHVRNVPSTLWSEKVPVKGQTHRENLEESQALCYPLRSNCCKSKCIIFWSFGRGNILGSLQRMSARIRKVLHSFWWRGCLASQPFLQHLLLFQPMPIQLLLRINVVGKRQVTTFCPSVLRIVHLSYISKCLRLLNQVLLS